MLFDLVKMMYDPDPDPAPSGGTLLADPAPEGDPTPAADPVATDPAPEGDPAPAADPEDKPAEGAPEAYADYTLPEGVTANPELLTEFNTLAKSMNLTQEQAQSLVDMQIKAVQNHTEAAEKMVNEQRAAWRTELSKLPASKELIADAKKAIARFGDDEVKQLIEGSWLGDNPAVIKLLARVGKASNEATLLSGGVATTSEQKTAAEIIYPSKK